MEYHISYEHFFQIPEGAEYTHVICTTMSMDYIEQLKIIGCAHQMKEIKLEKELLPILRRDIGLFYFFHDAERTDQSCENKDLQNDPALIMLHAMRYPVRMEEGVFHPKIILMRYKDCSDEVHFRLMVTSKNLTLKDSFEVGIVLDSENRNNSSEKNHNLDLLMDYLINQCNCNDLLNVIEKEIKEYNFILHDSNEKKINVKVSGIPDGKGVVEQEEQLLELWRNECSSEEKKLHILSPDYETSQDQIDKHRIYTPIDESEKEIDTHAKLYYLANEKGKAVVWLGSCNSSQAAMSGTNIECMVKINGVGSEVSYSNCFNVFGTRCKRITEGKDITGDKYKLIKLLNTFIGSCEFKGEDKKQEGNNNKESRREANITIRHNNCDKFFSDLENNNIELKCLPLGMKEEKSDGDTKWKSISKDSKSIVFWGSSKEKTNGMLRIKIDRKDNEKSAEQLVVFSDGSRKEILLGEKIISYDEFVNCCWIERLMEIESVKAIQYEDKLFTENLKIVKNNEQLTELQKNYLDEMNLIYKSLIKSKEGKSE